MSLQAPRRRGWDVDIPERVDPFRRMSEQMERMFEDLVGMSSMPSRMMPRLARAGEVGMPLPDVDVSETKEALEVDVDLPGLQERDIDITLSNGVLTITGERKEEREEKGRNFFRAERSLGHFSRRIMLPYNVDEDRVEARFDRGVLHITMPKSQEVKSRERHIEIKKG
ncbi:MAG: Hsp20/alpha crystallin family protein [Alphaproteobacteria bacterium]